MEERDEKVKVERIITKSAHVREVKTKINLGIKESK